MNDLPLHPAIVHVPLGLAVVIPILALGIAVAIRRGALPVRTWVIVVGLQAVLLGGGLFALRTGEQEEERVEDRTSESAVERHEALAQRFVWSAGGTLVLGAVTLVVRAHPATAMLMAATTLATIVTAGIGLQVGHGGGAIVHAPGGTATTAVGPVAPVGRDDD